MPIITGNKPIFRIKFRDANIREVRKGNELEWGLYYIKYFNEIKTEQEGENIGEYVWGYPDYKLEDFYLYIPEDVPNLAETNVDMAEYRSHNDGWYSDGSGEELYYIPAITRNFHRDLTLFCKWRQRQYRYSGTMKCDRYSWVVPPNDDGGDGS